MQANLFHDAPTPAAWLKDKPPKKEPEASRPHPLQRQASRPLGSGTPLSSHASLNPDWSGQGLQSPMQHPSLSYVDSPLRHRTAYPTAFEIPQRASHEYANPPSSFSFKKLDSKASLPFYGLAEDGVFPASGGPAASPSVHKNTGVFFKVKNRLHELMFRNLLLAMALFALLELPIFNFAVQVWRGRSNRSLTLTLEDTLHGHRIWPFVKLFLLRKVPLYFYYQARYRRTDGPVQSWEAVARMFRLEARLILTTAADLFAMYLSLQVIRSDLLWFTEASQNRFFGILSLLFLLRVFVLHYVMVADEPFSAGWWSRTPSTLRSLRRYIGRNLLVDVGVFATAIAYFLLTKDRSSHPYSRTPDADNIDSVLNFVFLFKASLALWFVWGLTRLQASLLHFAMDIRLRAYHAFRSPIEDVLALLKEVGAKAVEPDFAGHKIEADLLAYLEGGLDAFKPFFFESRGSFDERNDAKVRHTAQLMEYLTSVFKKLSGCFEYHLVNFDKAHLPFFDAVMAGNALDARMSLTRRLDHIFAALSFLNQFVHAHGHLDATRNEVREALGAADLLRANAEKYHCALSKNSRATRHGETVARLVGSLKRVTHDLAEKLNRPNVSSAVFR